VRTERPHEPSASEASPIAERRSAEQGQKKPKPRPPATRCVTTTAASFRTWPGLQAHRPPTAGVLYAQM